MDTDNNFQAGFDKAQMQSLIQKVGELDSKFDKFNQKLDTISADVNTVNTTIQVMNTKLDTVEKEKIPDMETRIRQLESSDRKWAGIAIAISAIVSIVGFFLKNIP